MQILGIRTASTCVRYAIVEWDGQAASLVNAAAENKLDFPADRQEISQKLQWLYSELGRIYRHVSQHFQSRHQDEPVRY